MTLDTYLQHKLAQTRRRGRMKVEVEVVICYKREDGESASGNGRTPIGRCLARSG